MALVEFNMEPVRYVALEPPASRFRDFKIDGMPLRIRKRPTDAVRIQPDAIGFTPFERDALGDRVAKAESDKICRADLAPVRE